jgi:endo-1,3-1,4-beta-glycanase ExoK
MMRDLRISRRRFIEATGTGILGAALTVSIVHGSEPMHWLRHETSLIPATPTGKTCSVNNASVQLASPESSDTLGTLDFVDDFDSFNIDRWERGDHKLGRGYIDPNNVSIDAGDLALKLSAKKFNGAEIASKDGYKYGDYTATMLCPKAAGSVTAFFLYDETRGRNDEIDIEIYNDGTGRMDFTVWARGWKTNSAPQTLGFDPAADFHDYQISFHQRRVRFYVDGHLLRSWISGMPVNSMKIVSNVWWPSWMSGPQPKEDKYARIDRIQLSGSST